MILSIHRKHSGIMRNIPCREAQKLREQIEDINKQIQKAKQNYDLEKAAELQYGELPKFRSSWKSEEKQVKEERQILVHEAVTDEEIARIISRWTGIPVAKLTEGERIRLCTSKMSCTNV